MRSPGEYYWVYNVQVYNAFLDSPKVIAHGLALFTLATALPSRLQIISLQPGVPAMAESLRELLLS
jgi:hypothetical protein